MSTDPIELLETARVDLAEELGRVERALIALDPTRAGRPALNTTAPTRSPRAPQRAKGSIGERLLALVTERPGVKPGEAAESLKISKPSLYTAASTLTAKGELRKDAGGYFPA